MNNLINKKFKDPKVTADGSDRAFVEAEKIKTLWFNTGTLCNIECKNCYIESSPKNDRLVYLTFDEVKNFIDEAIVSRILLAAVKSSNIPLSNLLSCSLAHLFASSIFVKVLQIVLLPSLLTRASHL